MRKHFYLITEHPDEDRVGGVSIYDTRLTPSAKNAETTHHARNMDTGERFTYNAVSLGYVDFEDEEDYEENGGDAAKRKLAEIDEEHLERAGIDVEEFFDDGESQEAEA